MRGESLSCCLHLNFQVSTQGCASREYRCPIRLCVHRWPSRGVPIQSTVASPVALFVVCTQVAIQGVLMQSTVASTVALFVAVCTGGHPGVCPWRAGQHYGPSATCRRPKGIKIDLLLSCGVSGAHPQSQVTSHKSRAPSHKSQVKSPKLQVTSRQAQVTSSRHTSQVTSDTSHVTRHMSQACPAWHSQALSHRDLVTRDLRL